MDPKPDLNEALVFAKVVELGSFVAASLYLSMPKATVSRKIQTLESRLGTKLLYRTTRRISLTEAGKSFYEHCELAIRELEEGELAVGRLRETPCGNLRVVAPISLSQSLLLPWLTEFMGSYPEISVTWLLANDDVDLLEHNIDVLLKVGPVASSDYVKRSLGYVNASLYAAPSYINRCGMPMTTESLSGHSTVSHYRFNARGRFIWPLEHVNNSARRHTEYIGVIPQLVCNDPSGLMVGTLAGIGIAILPDLFAQIETARGSLVKVLPEWRAEPTEVSALFPSRKGLSPKVRAFIDFMVKMFGANSS
ncbi:MAG: LysR substrate-binding domain-containing protein [Pseudomonadota bacterium]|nr:LysR substrate-binding domain-containing protein [Pseudomonadota bacterium]